jgi:hypothetical protein
LYERLTGDPQHRPIAKRIYDAWVRERSPSFQPGGSSQLWTEREVAFAPMRDFRQRDQPIS